MGRWQIYCAIMLRRFPEIVPKMDPIQAKVHDIFWRYEVAKGKLSDHELQHIEDTKLIESNEESVTIRETAQDRDDKWTKEKSEFKFAEYNDRLSYTKYMFRKQKFGPTDDTERWLLPQTSYDDKIDSNLLETARRALKEQLNVVNGYRVISKIPSSCYHFNYPKKLVSTIGYQGAKVFFIKAVMDANPSSSVLKALEDGDKVKWATLEEAQEFVGKDYLQGMRKGLLSERRVDVDKILSRAFKSASASSKPLREVRQRQ